MATQNMKDNVATDEVLAETYKTNRDGLVNVATRLKNRGNLTSKSRLATLSSTPSNYTDPDTRENYPGPWFYYPVGRSKAEGVRDLRKLAQEIGAKYVDFVAPDIEGTLMGDYLKDNLPLFEALHKLHSSEPFERSEERR